MPWTRASELARAIACPASAVLPRVPDKGSDAAAWGTEVHAWKAGEPTTARVEGWAAGKPAKWTRELLWPAGTHEVLLALDPEGAWRNNGTKAQNAAVRATLDDNWAAGEADWVADIPWVDDLKTGWHPGPPASLPQLRLYGLAVCRLTDEDHVLLSITHWPRYPLGAGPYRLTEVAERKELESWWRGTVEPARLARGKAGSIRPGSHCRFCRCECEFRKETKS